MTHPSSSVAPPAPVHSDAHAVVARLDGGSVGDLKALIVVGEHPVRLSSYIPRTRGGAILGTVDHLTCTQSRLTKEHTVLNLILRMEKNIFKKRTFLVKVVNLESW